MRTVVAGHELLPKGLELESLSVETGRVSIHVGSGETRCVCPVCGCRSSRVHSRYLRTVSDLPWHGISVTLKVHSRHFFCDEPSCERKTFCERLPEVAARKTDRLEEALLAIALELGGRAGARLAAKLGIVAARDALLRRIKDAPLPEVGKVRVLGVDDFAFKKGSTYGTILVDLELREVVELLPERSQESLVAWFESHPGAAGADLRHICKRLGISARIVYRYKDLTEPPPRPAYKRRTSVLDPYVPYLVKRWNEGCHNGKRLYREIRERGYRNSEETCARFTAQLRRAEARGKPISSVPRARQGSVAELSPTAKNVAALFMRHEEKLDEEQEAYLGRLCDADEALADTRRLTQEFAEMVRRLEGEDLDGWLKDAEESRSTALQSFALGLRKDLDAVRAGLTEEWSNGCVEGFVHKLKLLKRQGYGRAGFELLRARMLAA